jgi:putative sigma-54 modulation protein
MDIVVVGKNGNVDSALRALTIEKVERVTKFASDARRSEVEYQHHPTRRAEDSHTCEILVHVKNHLVKGTAAATEYAPALDLALDKVEQQMRRLHERRVGKRNGAKARGGRALSNAAALVDVESDGASLADDDHNGAIVKTKQFSVKPMAAEEAALQMELLGHDFYLFTNAETGGASVIYRRRDGRLGLIEATG